jgi:hypothetical protein
VALAAFVLNYFANRLDASLIEEHWPGRERVRVVLQRTLGLANTVLGGPLWARIRRMMSG